jgi:hypothetical protein
VRIESEVEAIVAGAVMEREYKSGWLTRIKERSIPNAEM